MTKGNPPYRDDSPDTPKERDDAVTILLRVEKEVQGARQDMAAARSEMQLRDKLYLNAFSNLENRIEKVESKTSTDYLNTKYASKEEVKALKSAVTKAISSSHTLDAKLKDVHEDAHEALRQTSNHDWKHEADSAAIQTHMKRVEQGIFKMALEVKKDPTVIIPTVVALVGLGILFYFGKLGWPEVLGAIALLGIPSAFGKKHKKEDEAPKP